MCFKQTRSQLIKAGVKLLIQNKRKNSGSSSFDIDCKPPPLKMRPTTLPSPINNNYNSSSSSNNISRLNSSSSSSIPILTPAPVILTPTTDIVPSPTSTLNSPRHVTSPISVRSFPIKTDSTTSCDEEDDSDPKPVVRRHDVNFFGCFELKIILNFFHFL